MSMITFPKDDKNYKWTAHIKNKMLQYRISAQMIKTILRNPSRREEGIAPGTVAVMKRHDTPKRKEEMWIMYKALESPRKSAKKSKFSSGYTLVASSSHLLMISAWRYPGVSRIGEPIPIPEDIFEELNL